ncbi:MAG: AraC family transcriptional regulator [Proteobacteria bacterium]|nr:AraC family transcriptional regulator [Pseudomonadota bacterium]
MRRRNQQIIRFFNPRGLQYVQAVHGVNVANEFRRHVHNRFCIGIIQKGARVICQRGTSIVVPENSLFVINPGISHACKSQYEEHSYFVICVEAESMKAIASQISGKTHDVPYFKSILIHNRELGSKFRLFFSLVENTSSALEKESVLVSLLSALIMQYGNKPPIPFQAGSHGDAINRACEFIRMHYAQDLSLKQISRVACLSPFYFQRLFLEKTGVSPHDYLVQTRIRKALELLSEGHNIADVSLDTGFVDQSHFTRFFKRVTGITPGGYLHNVRKDCRQTSVGGHSLQG